MIVWYVAGSTPKAHADVFAYPCNPGAPGMGMGAEAIGIGGQFCDGPTEVNLAHLHCESGGAHLGGLGLAGQNGVSLGVLGTIGGSGEGCSYRCPDNTLAPAPNPPEYWMHHGYLDVGKVIKLHKAFCVVGDHLASAGPTSTLVSPDEGLPPDGTNIDDTDYKNATLPKPNRGSQGGEPSPEGTLPIPTVPIPGFGTGPLIP